MTQMVCRNTTVFIVLTAAVLLAGCANEAPVPEPRFIIKSGTVVISEVEFAQELDLKLTAYPYDVRSRAGEYNAMVLDLVSTLSEEAVIRAAAAASGITVSAEDLDGAVAEFKNDYPEDSFDQMLLENAIPYEVWKSRLKKDMVVEKMVQRELVDVQEISPDDMVSFYKGLGEKDRTKEPVSLDETSLVEQLRMEKSQASYTEWIQGLTSTYPPEINREALAEFLINLE
ncbi:MAG: hypothetical protein MI802_24220 [Desulfobacterales bacterium]|nr:hypothetical protein [Desulfobacterales bacterium]